MSKEVSDAAWLLKACDDGDGSTHYWTPVASIHVFGGTYAGQLNMHFH